MTTDAIRARLEELRAEIRAERISYGEIAELQGLAEYIEPGDVELLEWAGVPEFPPDDEKAKPTFGFEADKDYHRVQADGEDLVSVQDHSDGTAYVIVYSSDAANGVAWEGVVRT